MANRCMHCGKRTKCSEMCERCHRRVRGRYWCKCCGARHPKPLQRAEWCMACSLVANDKMKASRRVGGFRMPEERIRELAARAKLHLPLFPERRERA